MASHQLYISEDWRDRLAFLKEVDKLSIEDLQPYKEKVRHLRCDANDYVSEWASRIYEKRLPPVPVERGPTAQDIILEVFHEKTPESTKKIVEMLKDKDWKVRSMALQLLVKMEPELVRPYVQNIVSVLDTAAVENNWNVQEWAYQLLSKVDPALLKPHVDDMTTNIGRREAVSRRSAMTVLGKQDNDTFATKYEEVAARIQDRDPFVREAVMGVLSTKDSRNVNTHALNLQGRLALGNERAIGVRSMSRRLLHAHNPTLLRCTWPPFMDDVFAREGAS